MKKVLFLFSPFWTQIYMRPFFYTVIVILGFMTQPSFAQLENHPEWLSMSSEIHFPLETNKRATSSLKAQTQFDDAGDIMFANDHKFNSTAYFANGKVVYAREEYQREDQLLNQLREIIPNSIVGSRNAPKLTYPFDPHCILSALGSGSSNVDLRGEWSRHPVDIAWAQRFQDRVGNEVVQFTAYISSPNMGGRKAQLTCYAPSNGPMTKSELQGRVINLKIFSATGQPNDLIGLFKFNR